MASGWNVEERTGPAERLHASWPAVDADPSRRAVALCRVSAPAVVLGSTQPESVIDRSRAVAAGVDVVHRRSGGGAVFLAPDDPVWIDVWVPAGDPLWRPDVHRAFDWLGEAWVVALGRAGATGLVAHRDGYLSCTRWSSLVCFGGVGTGEVVTDDGRKVVGLSQRRNRWGTLLQGACVLHWDPATLVGLLDLDEGERRAATGGLRAAVVGVNDLAGTAGSGAWSVSALAELLVAALPAG